MTFDLTFSLSGLVGVGVGWLVGWAFYRSPPAYLVAALAAAEQALRPTGNICPACERQCEADEPGYIDHADGCAYEIVDRAVARSVG